jgi:zona occludens toxin
MITFYTGIPRSGKTLKTVYDIYMEFIFNKTSIIDNIKKKFGIQVKEKDEKYLYLCTNINQFNFDLSDKFYKLDFKELYKNLEVLYKMYMIHKSDDEIIQKAKELKLYKVLFVFDECHNYFKEKKDDILVWWLTYHGHLYHDIILITQDMSLLSKEYKTQGEHFYKAIPQTYRLSKKVFKYSLYSSYHMYKVDFIKSITIKPTKEIFNMYVSGDKVDTKSILYKYIYLFFALIILTIFSFIFLIDSFSSDIEKKETNEKKIIEKSIDKDLTKESQSINDENPIKSNNSYDDYFMTLKCSTKYKHCFYDNKKIQLNTYLKLKDLFNVVELNITNLNNSYVQLDILANSKFYSIFNGGENNEKQNTNNNTNTGFNFISTNSK